MLRADVVVRGAVWTKLLRSLGPVVRRAVRSLRLRRLWRVRRRLQLLQLGSRDDHAGRSGERPGAAPGKEVTPDLDLLTRDITKGERTLSVPFAL